jgi:hypothetical protein
MDRICYGEVHLCYIELIRCQSDHNDYACSRERVVISGGDGINSSTRVSIVRLV